MIQNSKIIIPALVALCMFAFAPAHADGPDKNGGGEVDKNGGGEVDKNGPDTSNHVGEGETEKSTGEPPADSPPGGDGETDKNTGEPPAPPAPPAPPEGGGKNGGGGGNSGGSSYSEGSGLITCVVNGRVFKVRDIRKCYVQPSYGDYEMSPPVYHAQKKHRSVAVSGGMNYGGCGCAYNAGGYGYSYGQQPIIRYYKPASRAAVMQQQKRARREAYSYGGGYGYDAGYSMQGGYGYEGGYAMPRKKHRRAHYNAPIYMPSYDQGYVVHYGPTISKDGGY